MAIAGIRHPRVLYFTAGMVPTDAEVEEVQKCGNNVGVRNSQHVPDEPNPGQIEKCDYVAGTVPKAYAHIEKVPGVEVREKQPPAAVAKKSAKKPKDAKSGEPGKPAGWTPNT